MSNDASPSETAPPQAQSYPIKANKWVNDTGVTRLTENLFSQLKVDKSTAEANGDEINSGIQYEEPNESITTSVTSDQRIRFNLIRHLNTTSSIPTLKQFKSFATTLRSIDQNLSILPFQADKK
jgi:hypothetical protein